MEIGQYAFRYRPRHVHQLDILNSEKWIARKSLQQESAGKRDEEKERGRVEDGRRVGEKEKYGEKVFKGGKGKI